MGSKLDFFYDAQLRRYLLQFIRLFSDVKIQEGPDENGNVVYNRVPIRYADFSRMVGHILRENSESTILPSPMMTAWITNLERLDDRRIDRTFESQKEVTERKFNKNDGNYGSGPGNRYSVRRLAPVPYELTMRLDIWTTNTTSKLQIIEQILVLFNPHVEINQNDNPLDWSSVTNITLEAIDFSNKTLSGTETERDVASITFSIPIWINPPAKVTKRKVIDHIMNKTNISDDELIEETNKLILDPTSEHDIMNIERNKLIVVSPGNYKIAIGIDGASDDEVLLLDQHGVASDDVTWDNLLVEYGLHLLDEEEDIEIRLITDVDNEEESEYWGLLSKHDSDPSKLKISIDEDTFPPTIPPINRVIDPLRQWPSNFSNGTLPQQEAGQRYLVINEKTDGPLITPENQSLWGNITIHTNDIIMYDGQRWIVDFDSQEENVDQYVKDLATTYLLRFIGDDWIHAYFGQYEAGYWRIQV